MSGMRFWPLRERCVGRRGRSGGGSRKGGCGKAGGREKWRFQGMGRSEEGEKERERERRGKQGGRGQARQNKRRESAREGRRVYCRSEGKVNIKMENARNHGVR